MKNNTLQVILRCPKSADLLIVAGDGFNTIPDRATYKGERVDLFNLKYTLERLNYQYEQDKNEVYVIGDSSSGEIETSINPINRLSIALRNIGYKSKAIKFISDVLGEDINGVKIIGENKQNVTFNVCKIDLNQAYENVYLEIRIPSCIDKAKITSSLVEVSNKYGLEYNEVSYIKN